MPVKAKTAAMRRPGISKPARKARTSARTPGRSAPSRGKKPDLLKTYREKRDFMRTTEPTGLKGEDAAAQPIFVVQMHDASRLHYDFRIESQGVMPSWAVPKGPSLDPSVVRLAVRTEDHPLDYADFEGTIPEGEYGAGTVIVWDRGTYTNIREAKETEKTSIARSLEEGKVEIWLHGRKLKGGFVLIRTRKPQKGGEQWILKKIRDSQADSKLDITAAMPKSVKSGRTIDEVRDGGARAKPE